MGIIKSMLHRAHNLCDEEQGHRTDEVKLLSHAFICSGYAPKEVDRVIDSYVLTNQMITEKLNIEQILYVFHMYGVLLTV